MRNHRLFFGGNYLDEFRLKNISLDKLGKIDGSNYYEGWLFNYYMTPKTALKFERLFYKDEKVTKDYSIRLLREGKEFKSAPFRNEIITIKDLNKFSIKFFQK